MAAVAVKTPVVKTGPMWSKKVADKVNSGEAVAVAITLFPVKKKLDFPLLTQMKCLAPDLKCFHIDDKTDFRNPFRHHLHRYWNMAEEWLLEIAAQHPGKEIILLCWEKVEKDSEELWCHRQFVAEFIEQKWDTVVEEL
jgi:hypothetical protein